MLQKNELLIGFTISVLLSLFVNFSLLVRHYDVLTVNMPPKLPFDNLRLYFSMF